MSSLAVTRHASSRAAQRGIRISDTDLILLLGSEVKGGDLSP